MFIPLIIKIKRFFNSRRWKHKLRAKQTHTHTNTPTHTWCLCAWWVLVNWQSFYLLFCFLLRRLDNQLTSEPTSYLFSVLIACVFVVIFVFSFSVNLMLFKLVKTHLVASDGQMMRTRAQIYIQVSCLWLVCCVLCVCARWEWALLEVSKCSILYGYLSQFVECVDLAVDWWWLCWCVAVVVVVVVVICVAGCGFMANVDVVVVGSVQN